MHIDSPTETASHFGDVFLLHGIAQVALSMSRLARYLRRLNYHAFNFDYPSTRHPIETLALDHLHPFIQKHHRDSKRPLHFVTHSMGGLVVRYYLTQHRPAKMGRVVMLAPPNQGSEVADRLRNWRLFKWIFGPAGQELGTTTDCICHRLGAVDYEVGVIAGHKVIDPISAQMLPGPNDGKVTVERTKVEGMTDFLVVPSSHTFIMQRKVVMEQTAYFLAHGKFAE